MLEVEVGMEGGFCLVRHLLAQREKLRLLVDSGTILSLDYLNLNGLKSGKSSSCTSTIYNPA